MKLIVGSDFHGNEAMVERFIARAEEEHAEIALICGDITNFGTLREATHLLSLFTRISIPVLFVPGNCDPPSLLGVDLEGVRSLHGKTVSYGEVSIDEEQIMVELNRAAEGLVDDRRFILLSHAPPRDTRLDRTRFYLHVGSVSVRRFIEDKEPFVVFCGHIHEAKGKDRIKNTILVNPGPARDGDYVSAYLGKDDVVVEFGSLYE